MKILILGHARHGKDTVAEILRDEHGFTFISSSAFAASRVMMPYFARYRFKTPSGWVIDQFRKLFGKRVFRAYDSVDECFEDRVNFRDIWHQQIAAYNTPDKARLPREILEEADIYVGMRCNQEYQASKPLFDAVLWVEAFGRGLPAEPTSSFNIDKSDEMIVIDNSGTLDDLRETVATLMGGERKVA